MSETDERDTKPRLSDWKRWADESRERPAPPQIPCAQYPEPPDPPRSLWRRIVDWLRKLAAH